MKNGSYQLRKHSKSGAGTVAGQVLLSVAAVGALVVVVRSLPDLIRYVRLRRM